VTPQVRGINCNAIGMTTVDRPPQDGSLGLSRWLDDQGELQRMKYLGRGPDTSIVVSRSALMIDCSQRCRQRLPPYEHATVSRRVQD
jgi:hypothetical protein